MFKKIISIAASAAVVASVLLAAPAQAAGQSIRGQGSSFANNAMQACIGAYNVDTVTYLGNSSGTGRTAFRTGAAEFAGSDSTYPDGGPFPAGGYVTVPLFGGPVAFAYTTAGVSDGLNLTAQNLSDIFTGRISKWNDAKIKANNTKIKLPNKNIKVNFRNTSSGTNENVSNYLLQTLGASSGWVRSSSWSTAIAGALPDGVNTAPGTGHGSSSALAGALEDQLNGFGYFDLSDAITADVAVAKLKNAAGAFVAPTSSAAAKFLNAQSFRTGGTDQTNGTVEIDFTKSVSGAYQLSILVYGIAPKFVAPAGNPRAVSTDAQKIAVRDFFKYVAGSCIPAKAASLGYVALGGKLKTNALNQIKSIG
jgi:phosphate transport system substrate-binding protein